MPPPQAQGVLICGHAGLLINKLSAFDHPQEIQVALLKDAPPGESPQTSQEWTKFFTVSLAQPSGAAVLGTQVRSKSQPGTRN